MTRAGISLVAIVASTTVAGVLSPLATSAAPPSTDPYKASVAYSRCMRAHGIPEPMPDRNGDIHLTLAQEQKLRAVGRKRVERADKICFGNLRAAFSTKPLSGTAIRQAKLVLGQLKACIAGLGFAMGNPVVKNLSRGRAFFGFSPTVNSDPPSPALTRAEHTCERRVRMPEKLDRIIHADRDPS